MYIYKNRQLDIDAKLQEIFDSRYFDGPMSDKHVEKACMGRMDIISDEKAVEYINNYMRGHLDINGLLDDNKDPFNGYKGVLTVENFEKKSTGEIEIRERLFGDYRSTEPIPVEEYPKPLQSFVSKWRVVFSECKSGKTKASFAKLSVLYNGEYYSFSYLELGGTTAQFIQHIKEMEKDLEKIGCAYREEVWY